MRYPIVKSATLALLGLSNILCANGAPTAISDVQDRSVDNKLAIRAKTVPDLTASPYDYKVSAGMALKNKPITYTITKTGVNGNIDVIKVDTTEKSVTIEDADNAIDKTSNKLHLSDLELSLFVHKGGKKATDLAIVRFSNVQEKSTKPVIVQAFEKLTPTNSVITVTPTSTGEAKTIFNDLQKTSFGKNVGFLHTDYAVGAVTKYEISGSKTIPTLAAYV